MKLWQFVIDRDRSLDLTSADPGRRWAYEMVWVNRGADGGEAGAPAGWFGDWTRNVRALRSLAGRLTGAKRLRAADIEPAEADRVFDYYLSLLTVRVLRTRRSGGHGGRPRSRPGPAPTVAQIVASAPDFTPGPLTRRTFAGLTLEPGRIGDEFWAGAAHDTFWQEVFLSLVDDSFSAPVCRDCGGRLCATPTGRPSRRERCPRCQVRRSRRLAGTEAVRRAWREQQARHRAAAREEKNPKRKGR